jgi:hypothetical protein
MGAHFSTNKIIVVETQNFVKRLEIIKLDFSQIPDTDVEKNKDVII